MNLQRLIFKRSLYSNLGYEKLRSKLSSRIGLNLKLGLITKNEINLYYLKDVYTKNGLDRIPACEIKIVNKETTSEKTKVIFKLAGFYVFFAAIIPMLFIAILYFGNAPILYEPLAIYPFLYLFLLYIHTDQSNRFAKDLQQLENEGEYQSS
ncbi:hypothetical protein C9994_10455 [Marivirga lumbricoides]|uniref:Uncharacterized protein n=1 Tax=Marivirga lumbricoides TaxID=1046115 RepID=A0A2T4DPI3_9BACT|nr:hypothetical protein C9994_10455 [Marivirga lumbricoides]